MEGSHSTTKPIPHAYAIITDIMHIYNTKIINIILLIAIFYGSIHILNIKRLPEKDKENKAISTGFVISNSYDRPIISLNTNEQTSNIQKLLFTNNNTLSITNKNDLNNYLINIFCSETTNKYIKVASGSGVFLSDPDEDVSIVLTNAHVARHLLDSNKKCVGRTKSPTTTTHTLTLRYIPSYWLNTNHQYIIGDPDQNSTGEFDFAIIESKKIKNLKPENKNTNIYNVLKPKLKIKMSDYANTSLLDKVYIYSYPARQTLSKNVYNPLYQKKDSVWISNVYSSPTYNIYDSLLDVSGSQNIDHGSSGGMVVSQGQNNNLIGLSSVLIKENKPQVVRVVTIKHVLETLKNDLIDINNAQTDPYLITIKDILSKKEADSSLIQILKNIKLTSVLENQTRLTLKNLNIIR